MFRELERGQAEHAEPEGLGGADAGGEGRFQMVDVGDLERALEIDSVQCARSPTRGILGRVGEVLVRAGDGSEFLRIDGEAVLPALAFNPGEQILAGGDAQRTTLSIRGRGNWTQSAAFHEACVGALAMGGAVALDLTLCEHLDSTFLGTIHELVEHADRSDVELRLQGVMPPVEELFLEVGMKRVMEHIVPVMLPLPRQMSPLVGKDQERRSQTLRILKAHEGLAALSESNRREFDPLLEVLRREVGAS